MNRIEGRTRDGEVFVLWRSPQGEYYCPVCGHVVSTYAPYSTDGDPSFEMCVCGFEYGYDDSPLASPAAVEGLAANWRRWRDDLLRRAAQDPEQWAGLEATLANIHLTLGPEGRASDQTPAADEKTD